MNYYKFNIGDFAAATRGLSMVERGVYREMLDQYYLHEKPLPLDRHEVYRLIAATSPDERKATDFMLKRHFTKQADGYHQKRCDEVIAAYQAEARNRQKAAGKRWGKAESDDAPASETDAPASKTDAPASETDAPASTVRRHAPASKIDADASQPLTTNHEPLTINQEAVASVGSVLSENTGVASVGSPGNGVNTSASGKIQNRNPKAAAYRKVPSLDDERGLEKFARDRGVDPTRFQSYPDLQRHLIDLVKDENSARRIRNAQAKGQP